MKTLTTHKELLKCDGKKVTLEYEGEVKHAILEVESGWVYLRCVALDRLRYYWISSSESNQKYEYNNKGVTNIQLVEEELTEPSFKQGDILVDEYGEKRKVLGVCGEVYLVSYANNNKGCMGGFTIDEVEEKSWHLCVEKPKSRTVNIDGKTYELTEDLKKIIKDLKEIK